ncbi:MAG: archease [Bacteroidota bacterium]
MVSFKLLEHPADIGIEATGSTLVEAFASAAEGLISIIVDPETVRTQILQRIEIEADDDEALLVKWLNELVYLFDAEHFVCSKIEIHSLVSHTLKATIHGELFLQDRHTTRMDIKAVTFHQLFIGECNGRWTIRVFVDI